MSRLYASYRKVVKVHLDNDLLELAQRPDATREIIRGNEFTRAKSVALAGTGTTPATMGLGMRLGSPGTAAKKTAGSLAVATGVIVTGTGTVFANTASASIEMLNTELHKRHIRR